MRCTTQQVLHITMWLWRILTKIYRTKYYGLDTFPRESDLKVRLVYISTIDFTCVDLGLVAGMTSPVVSNSHIDDYRFEVRLYYDCSYTMFMVILCLWFILQTVYLSISQATSYQLMSSHRGYYISRDWRLTWNRNPGAPASGVANISLTPYIELDFPGSNLSRETEGNHWIRCQPDRYSKEAIAYTVCLNVYFTYE